MGRTSFKQRSTKYVNIRFHLLQIHIKTFYLKTSRDGWLYRHVRINKSVLVKWAEVTYIHVFIFFEISLYTHTRLGIVVKTGQNMWFGFSRSQRIHSYRQFPPGSSTVYYRWGLIKSNRSNQADFNALISTIRAVGYINVNLSTLI